MKPRDAHAAARERWLSTQAGPRYRERLAAYQEMATASAAIQQPQIDTDRADESDPYDGTGRL